jgi:hypothetical protein
MLYLYIRYYYVPVLLCTRSVWVETSKQVVIDLSSSEAVFREGKEGGETEVMSIVCTRGSSKTAG